ncbi:uncharacterized protein LOC103968597 [Musa acuminata AAA Group]|uniref:uncharacterized protein LOC103968597 n=1 Tax=Musa acuminata AAA Group TaxID=214697 RepID=UPI0008A0DE4F|nr:PREDICTED: uncharacterized protein LOC103968597 isoform X1 [Musa acuminata subsp. malaccensis]
MSASGKPPHFLTNISACRPISGWESIISLPAVSVNSFQAASHGKASTLIFFFTPIWSQRSSFRVPIRPQAMEDHGQEAFVLGDGVPVLLVDAGLVLHSFGQHAQEGLPLVSADGIPCKYSGKSRNSMRSQRKESTGAAGDQVGKRRGEGNRSRSEAAPGSPWSATAGLPSAAQPEGRKAVSVKASIKR